MDLGLKDAAAVIVGGGRGMGLAAAHCLADDGARVALIGRTADVLDKAATELSDRGSPDAVGLVAETGDAAAVIRVFDEIGERVGTVSSTGSSTRLGRGRGEHSTPD